MALAIPTVPRRRQQRLRMPLIIGLGIVLVLLVLAVFPGSIAPYDPRTMDYTALMHPPSASHPFGTDNLGRDVLSRVIWATRVDLQIAIFCTIFPIIFGTTIGALVGYYGGVLDTVFGRIVDITIIIPFLVLVIAIVAALGPGLLNMYIAVSLIGWVFYAKIMRAEIQVQKESDYAAAARVLGYSEARIIFRHLLPNAITPIIVYWMTDMALDILLGSSLGYLGLGAQPPTAEWGVLINDAKNFMNTAWWMSIFPGIGIVLAGLGFSLVGDGIADIFRRQR